MQATKRLNRSAAWLAVFGRTRSVSGDGSNRSGIARDAVTISDSAGRTLNLLDDGADWLPESAGNEICRVIFDGVLHDRAELQKQFSDGLPNGSSNAELIAQAFRLWGENSLHRIKGIFALIIWDKVRDLVLCVRDPLGMHPLFYCQVAQALLKSPSIETLLAHPEVSPEINRARLVNYLARRWEKHDESCFTNVQRVRPGHVLRVDCGGLTTYRYWDPLSAGRPITWIPDGEAQERFDALLQQAVSRVLALGPAAIRLSGGLDSSAVAMVATDLCRRERWPLPLALSLTVTKPYDEESVGRAMAADLGLQRILVPYEQAVAPDGLVSAGLKLSRLLPAPMFNINAPAFMHLSHAAWERGCRVLVTGEGADEWLGMSPLLAANMLSPANLIGIFHLSRSLSRYYQSVRWAGLRGVLWQFGVKPLLRSAWRTSTSAAHGVLLGREHPAARNAAYMISQIAPEPWIAPEPSLRTQLARRIEDNPPDNTPTRGAENGYRKFFRSMLDAPHLGLRTEEAFVLGRHTGVREQDPFWDADLIDLLVRIRPQIRNKGGVSKVLVRGALSRRFPLRKFESQRKSRSQGFFIESALRAEARRAASALGDKWVLGELGVIDAKQVQAFLENPPAGKGWRVWDLLNLESWVRAHHKSGN